MIKRFYLIIALSFLTGCSNADTANSKFIIDSIEPIDDYRFWMNFRSDKDFSTRHSSLTVTRYIYCTKDPKIQSIDYDPDYIIKPILDSTIPQDKKLEKINEMYKYKVILSYAGDIHNKPKSLNCRIFTGNTFTFLQEKSNIFTIFLP